MAEVEEIEVPELEPSVKKKSAGKSGKKKSGLPINLIIIFAAQLLLAFAGFYFVSNFIQPDPALQKVLVEYGKQEEIIKSETSETTEGVKEGPKEIYLLEDIIVNPAGTRGSRYLSISVGIEMNAAEEEEGGGGHGGGGEKSTPIDKKKLQLKDALINILSAKTIVQLTSVEEKELIRNEILEKFGEILDPLPVYQIYFVDFVLQ